MVNFSRILDITKLCNKELAEMEVIHKEIGRRVIMPNYLIAFIIIRNELKLPFY